MKCPNCNSEVLDGAKFCSQCGTAIPQKNLCPKCGAELKDGMKFCPKCGTEIRPQGLCPKCGTELKDGMKFCPKCGCPVEYNSVHTENSESYSSSEIIFPIKQQVIQDKTIQKERVTKTRKALVSWFWVMACVFALLSPFMIEPLSSLFKKERSSSYSPTNGVVDDSNTIQQEEIIRQLVTSYNLYVEQYRVELETSQMYSAKVTLRNLRSSLNKIRDYARQTNNNKLLDMYYEQDKYISFQERQFGL